MQNPVNLTELYSYIDIQLQNTLFNIFHKYKLVNTEEFSEKNPNELM